MQANVPDLIQPLLQEYLTVMERALPGFLIGFYLHGSVVLGAFNPGLSDIDFIAVISRRCTENDVQQLAEIHQRLAEKYPDWMLEGGYLQPEELGNCDAVEPYPCYHDKKLISSGYHDLNWVTWWLLKSRGIALVGPAPEALDFSVDWERLTAYMRRNLNTYWRRFTRDPARIAWLISDYGIQWTVLGVLRLFYSLHEPDMTSKIGAGEYGLTHLPPRWHRLIQEAIRIRRQEGTSLYRSRLLRALDAFRFLHYLIRLCNTHLV